MMTFCIFCTFGGVQSPPTVSMEVLGNYTCVFLHALSICNMLIKVNFLVVSSCEEKRYDDGLRILHYGVVMGILYNTFLRQ